MKKLLVFMLALSIVFLMHNESFGEKNTFFDSVKFIQYLDENTALEEVRNGNLDLYYYRISSDRLENIQNREGLQVFDSTGGSYSILVNPAESEEFNPFSIKEIRFALNYLVDRKLIVNELMGGYGSPIISYYGPSDPEYLTVIEKLEEFNFKYNPSLAEQIISKKLLDTGAVKKDGKWKIKEKPIEITIFIRSDDPVRKSIGEILAAELQNIGFTVKKDFGDLNKAFVIVYGSNPSDLKWSLYTEGWNRSAFARYDSVGLGQMYSPWFSNMPGFNDPSYWNYKNEKIDGLTQKIYTGDFDSQEQRTKLIRDSVVEGVNESVRVFLASKIDQYVTNEKISGVVNDFGAGVPSRFTPINARGDSNELVIG
ncbi:MAG: ABC transporter substrate-binding protein, partial [Nitrosopumilus sp.]|nr:ABC transporter substrate-binding protein [Nitrosopumilus sp.]